MFVHESVYLRIDSIFVKLHANVSENSFSKRNLAFYYYFLINDSLNVVPDVSKNKIVLFGIVSNFEEIIVHFCL